MCRYIFQWVYYRRFNYKLIGIIGIMWFLFLYAGNQYTGVQASALQRQREVPVCGG